MEETPLGHVCTVNTRSGVLVHTGGIPAAEQRVKKQAVPATLHSSLFSPSKKWWSPTLPPTPSHRKWNPPWPPPGLSSRHRRSWLKLVRVPSTRLGIAKGTSRTTTESPWDATCCKSFITACRIFRLIFSTLFLWGRIFCPDFQTRFLTT